MLYFDKGYSRHLKECTGYPVRGKVIDTELELCCIWEHILSPQYLMIHTKDEPQWRK